MDALVECLYFSRSTRRVSTPQV